MEAVITNTENSSREITYEEYDRNIAVLAEKIKTSDNLFTALYPIPRGGYYPAIKLSQLLHLPIVTTLDDDKASHHHTLIVDDIVDSGRTIAKFREYHTASVYLNTNTEQRPSFFAGEKGDKFLLFPDEKQGSIDEQIRRILQFIGEDPEREGLKGTPERIIRMWKEIFRGYHKENAPKITVFQNGADGIVYDNMVVDEGDFYSCCEHHMMPFFGHYWFAYIPHSQGRILGISKIGRVVDFCAARLQIQERLVHDVVEMLSKALGKENPPLGIALVMTGEHLCKTMRGVKKKGTMTSSYLTGLFKTDASLRAEFMSFAK